MLNPDSDSDLMRYEIFGPILPILDVDSLDEAIKKVNEGDKPLAAYIFSNNKTEIRRVFTEIPAGGDGGQPHRDARARAAAALRRRRRVRQGAYHGKWGYEAFSHRKATLIMRTKPDLKMVYPPYSELDKKLLRKLA